MIKYFSKPNTIGISNKNVWSMESNDLSASIKTIKSVMLHSGVKLGDSQSKSPPHTKFDLLCYGIEIKINYKLNTYQGFLHQHSILP